MEQSSSMGGFAPHPRPRWATAGCAALRSPARGCSTLVWLRAPAAGGGTTPRSPAPRVDLCRGATESLAHGAPSPGAGWPGSCGQAPGWGVWVLGV